MIGKKYISVKLSDWKQLWQWGINNCIHCGSYFVNNSLLCPYCENLLFVEAGSLSLFELEKERAKTFGLLSWRQDQNLILNKLILNLKGNKQAKAWNYFSHRVALNLKEKITLSSEDVICPCPSWSGNKDHASLFAEALAREMNLKSYHLLKNSQQVSKSKELTRLERLRYSSQRFEIRGEIFEKITDPHRKKVLFVDDVITTGATLSAASEKLKDFKQIIGICLAFRR